MKRKKPFHLPEPAAIADKIGSTLDIPPGSLPGGVHIELESNRSATVDGCLGVLEYGECTISLNTGKLVVKIEGCSLTVASMQNGLATVTGCITSIRFET